MFKMSNTSEYHGHVIQVAVFNRIIVPDRSSRLNKCSNTGFMPKLYAIIDREKWIRCQNCTVKIKLELFCFFNRLTKRIDPACLTASFSYQHFIFYKCNGV